MRTMIVPLILIGALAATSCRPNAQMVRGKESSDISAVGVFGGAVVNVAPVACAGRISLNGGAAEVKDACFTGDTNIVLCTDVTSISPVRCAPRGGALEIGGSGSDVIAYARMR